MSFYNLAIMSNEHTVSHLVVVSANSVEQGEESVFTVPNFSGCERGKSCGAWGAAVCEITVRLGGLNPATPTSAESGTRLLAIGCNSCNLPAGEISQAIQVDKVAELDLFNRSDYDDAGVAKPKTAHTQANLELSKVIENHVISKVQTAIRKNQKPQQ